MHERYCSISADRMLRQLLVAGGNGEVYNLSVKKAEELNRIFLGKTPYRDESWHSPGGRAIREVVFGFNDGMVSTVGFVVGVAAALADPQIVLITGLAEVMAGSFSMFFGSYLSTKNQREFFEQEIEREKFEIREMPEKEREEIRKIYAAKGFQGSDLEMVVGRITSDEGVWLKCMMEEELGLIFESMDNPLKVGFTTGLSFMLGGLVPLLPYMYSASASALLQCIGLSGAGLFAMGIVKTFLTRKNWLKSALESLLIGLLATGAGLLFGKIASHFTGFQGTF